MNTYSPQTSNFGSYAAYAIAVAMIAGAIFSFYYGATLHDEGGRQVNYKGNQEDKQPIMWYILGMIILLAGCFIGFMGYQKTQENTALIH
jgi:amino acid transporter